MIIKGKIRNEKLQYDINRAATKISPLSWVKINKYGCITGKSILPTQQHRLIEEGKSFNYQVETFKKQVKPNEEQGEKKIKAISFLGLINKNSIKLSNLNSKIASNYNFNKYLWPAVSLENWYDESSTLEDTYWEQMWAN